MDIGWVLLIVLAGSIGVVAFAQRAGGGSVARRAGRRAGVLNDGVDTATGLTIELGDAGGCDPASATAACDGGSSGGDGGGGGGGD